MVDLSTLVTAVVEYPTGVKEKLFLKGAVVLRGGYLTGVSNPVGVGKHLFFYGFHSSGTGIEVVQVHPVIHLLVTRVAHDTERVSDMAILRHRLEPDGDILPRAIEVLIGKRVFLVELVTLVLVVYFVIQLLPRRGVKGKVEHFAFGGECYALQHGISHVHLHTNGIAFIPHHGVELLHGTGACGEEKQEARAKN